MLLEDAPAFPAVWGQDYGREGNSSRNRASPCSIINRCIMEKERDGHEPSDSFVSLSKSPSSQASEGRHGALMQRHHVREMETFHVVNPQVVRETLMRKKASKEHPELLGEGDTQDSKRQEPCLTLYWLPFFTALLHP